MYLIILYSSSYISTTAPTVPSRCNLSLAYNQVSKKLLFINSTWSSVQVSYLSRHTFIKMLVVSLCRDGADIT